LIDRPRRSRLGRLHNPDQRNDFPSLLIDLRGENHVHVIGHHNANIQLVSSPMVMKTRCQYDISRDWRQDPAKLSDARDEVRREVFLEMRQVAAIRLHE